MRVMIKSSAQGGYLLSQESSLQRMIPSNLKRSEGEPNEASDYSGAKFPTHSSPGLTEVEMQRRIWFICRCSHI